METQKLLLPRFGKSKPEESLSEEEWTDKSSNSSGSYYSDSDSTVPDWEPYVDDFSGELLYIDCHPFVTQNNKDKNEEPVAPLLSKTQLRRSTRGKFLRLIRRRESKRRSKKNQKPIDNVEANSTSKVKFQDLQEGEEKEVMLEIDTENRHNLSSDKSLAESLLGLIISTLSDGSRVMIAGFSYDSKAKNERSIKIGDWLKSINNLEVNVQNLDDILQKFINREEVLLKLVRVAGVDVTKEPPIHELNLESNFVRELLNSKSSDEQLLLQTLCKHPIGILYVNTEKLSESNKGYEDVVYCFPRPQQKNILCNSRGMFITLNHLIKDISSTKPRTSSLSHRDRLCHVVYTSFGNNLLLFMLPDNRATANEAILINDELVRFLKFSYKTLDRCFTVEQCVSQVDYFFARFFARILSSGLWATAQQFVELQNLSTKSFTISPCQFEEVMPVAPTLSLPDDAQMQIDDALSELEASDYRDWNEEPLDCQRLFTILGSALYHSGYLLATHLIHEDLIDVHCYCKQQGLFHLSRTEPVKSLILWREVFPFSCNRLEDSSVKIPDGRRYLLVVGSSKDLLAVIMEAGGCTEPAEANTGPDAFYVEEAQATLAHVHELGIGDVADRLLSAGPGPQVAAPVPPFAGRRTDFLGFPRAAPTTTREPPASPKKNEVTSILKRRSSDQNFATQGRGSLRDDPFDGQSEDSGSQGGCSERSGRSFGKRCDSGGDDESEADDYGDGGWSTSSFDISEVRQSLLSETEEHRPVELTAGLENILYHYVQLDMTEGILLCPAENRLRTQTYEAIINNFRRCCQKIHGLFQNTLRFKNMPAQDMAKSVMNKSLIAIKEHGVVFECPYLDDKDKKSKISYWVVGRLFYLSHPREVYVCYQDGIPQNLIEIVFKMNIGTIS